MQATAIDGCYSPKTSDDLIETYRLSGRPEDFEQIVRRFAALVISECRRVTGNAHDAEDASQLAFLALAIEIRSGTAILRAGAWLQRVARRQALKIVRSRGRRKRREDAARRSELLFIDADARLDAQISAGIIRDAIDQLPERYRLPLVLHYFGGMSLELIAGELKVSRPAIGTRLHRGRKMLANSLGQHGVLLNDRVFAAALSMLVPAAVIGGVMRSTAAAHMKHAPVAATTLSATVARILQAVCALSPRRAIGAALILAALTAGGSSIAKVAGVGWRDLPNLRAGDAVRWIGNLFRARPRIKFSGAASQRPARHSVSIGDSAAADVLLLRPSWQPSLCNLNSRLIEIVRKPDNTSNSFVIDEAPAAQLAAIEPDTNPSDNGIPENLNATVARQTFATPAPAQTSPRIPTTTFTIVPEPSLLLPSLAGVLLLRRRREH
jgi:RNA polymerase sigma-70 factor (ECF subfamily)